MKFAASIAIFTATIGWLLQHVPRGALAKGTVRWGVSFHHDDRDGLYRDPGRLAERPPLTTSPAYSTRRSSARWGRDRRQHRPPGLLLGLFMIRPAAIDRLNCGGSSGLVLIPWERRRGADDLARGAHDGGQRRPARVSVVDWSTRAGDLRIPQALGLPRAPRRFRSSDGRFRPRRTAAGTALVFLFALAWVGASAWLFAQAMAGRPLVT